MFKIMQMPFDSNISQIIKQLKKRKENYRSTLIAIHRLPCGN